MSDELAIALSRLVTARTSEAVNSVLQICDTSQEHTSVAVSAFMVSASILGGVLSADGKLPEDAISDPFKMIVDVASALYEMRNEIEST